MWLLSISAFAVYSGVSIKRRDEIGSWFDKSSNIVVLVLSYRCSNEGINRGSNTILVEWGVAHPSEHQAWSRVRQIGQTTSKTQRLINLETIDMLMERAHRERQSPTPSAPEIIEQPSENKDINQVFDTLIGKTPPAVLRAQTIGRRST